MKLRTDLLNQADAHAPETAHRRQRVKELLLDALSLEPDARQPFLETTVDDQTVRDEVLELIDLHERAGRFMRDPSTNLEFTETSVESPGSVIGRYTLVRLIGEGGFGRVYLAEQREPVVRSVALKILKLGMDTEKIVARFEAERQSLALMNHPGIARVFDAGSTDTGRPYFVMELVDGVPISKFCATSDAGIEARLALFVQACAAIQHAHMKGVIHRDLKPSNVLVADIDGSPTVKIIDFGIAKAVHASASRDRAMTEHRQVIGTPQYMSPEQADGHASDIDTRTDVYSLGVILYELLTGTTPIDARALRNASYNHAQRLILEHEAIKPSVRLRSGVTPPESEQEDRATLLRQLEPRVRGDLDWITLKALEKDRERRYSSAAELSDDIERHLKHEPVRAGPPGTGYRLRKFVRRNRATVVAASLIVLALVVGIVGTGIGLAKARDSADQANAISEFMREFLISVDPDIHGADVRLADVLDDAAIAAEQWFEGHPELEAQVRELLGQVYMRLSRNVEAEREYRLAADLFGQVHGPRSPETLEAMIGVGHAMANQERPREVEQYLGEVATAIERTFGRSASQTLQTTGLRADARRMRGQLVESEDMLRDALDRAEAADVEESVHLWLLNALTGTLRQKLATFTPAPSQADIDAYRDTAAELLERARHQGQRGGWFVRSARLNLADVAFYQRQFAECAAQCRALLQESQGMVGECHSARISAMALLARSVNRQGDDADEADEAADLYLKVIECTRSSAGADSMRVLAFLCDALPILDRAKRWADGERCAREVINMLRAIGGGHVGTLMYEAYVVHFLSEQGRQGEVQELLTSLEPIAAEEHDRAARMRFDLVRANELRKQGQFEKAERLLLPLEQNYHDGVVLTFEYPDEVFIALAELYRAWGKSELVAQYDTLQHVARERGRAN